MRVNNVEHFVYVKYLTIFIKGSSVPQTNTPIHRVQTDNCLKNLFLSVNIKKSYRVIY